MCSHRVASKAVALFQAVSRSGEPVRHPVEADQVEACAGPEAVESLTFGAFGDAGTREFFTHVRFHKHHEDQIAVHLLVELYARNPEEASEVLTTPSDPKEGSNQFCAFVPME